MVSEEMRMTIKNVKAVTASAKGGRATPTSPQGKGISQSDLRRSTYTPERPSGVPARELGFKKA
jgi:hypothetical protein